MRPKKKVLILTAGFGEGHNTAAHGVAAAIRYLAPETAEAQVIDLFADSYGRFNNFMRRAYLAAINHTPLLWQKIYELLDRTKFAEANLRFMGGALRKLANLLENERPVAVISVYPAYSFLIRAIYPDAGARPFLFITVVTDSITVNSVWHRAPSDYFVVANEPTAEVLRQAGLDSRQIAVFGFPVTHRFALNHCGDRPAPSKASGRRVLYMVNSGRKEAPRLIRRLLEVEGIELTVTAGRDEKLRTELEEITAGRNARVLGWTTQLPELLMEHHLLISKAGGATVQEALAAKTPMIISEVVPGQEEGNARLLVENGCGMLALSTDKVAAGVRTVFENDAKLWREWHANMVRLSKPDAALGIAKFVLALAEARNGTGP